MKSRAASVRALGEFLREAGVGRVRTLEHEDDLPEIALLIDWAWARLSAAARRTLGVLAHVEGDHGILSLTYEADSTERARLRLLI